MDLFFERGYDPTTVAQIAERAGVTKSIFFRHFSGRRELLVAGQEALSRLLAERIAEASLNRSPLEVVAEGVRCASRDATVMTDALLARRVPAATVHLAAELGLLAFMRGYASWVEADGADDAGLEPYALAALDEPRLAARTLGSGLIAHSQKMTVAARTMAAMKVWAHRS